MMKYKFQEVIHDGLEYQASVESILHKSKSEFQSVEVIESGSLGRCLVLDTKIQSAELDEFVYHESLVHPALISHPNPKSVFIGGGGEGATLREVLRHQSVEKCVMVDIDGVAVNVSRHFLPHHADGAFSNPRAQLVIDDAKAWLERCEEQFDVMIFDLADPVDSGPCFLLYAAEFYRDVVLPKLKPGGIFVTQSGPAGLLSSSQVFTAIVRTVSDSFKHAVPYTSHMQSFCDMYGFTLASQDPLPQLSKEEVDKRLAERLGLTDAARKEIEDARTKETEWRASNKVSQGTIALSDEKAASSSADAGSPASEPLQYFDGLTHSGIFALPLYLRRAIAKEQRRITNDTPLYLA